jgi:hypothetical protein
VGGEMGDAEVRARRMSNYKLFGFRRIKRKNFKLCGMYSIVSLSSWNITQVPRDIHKQARK